MMLPVKVDFDLLDWQSSVPGERAKVYRDGPRQLRLVEFTSEFVEPHWCEKGPVGAHKAHSVTPVVRLVLVEDV